MEHLTEFETYSLKQKSSQTAGRLRNFSRKKEYFTEMSFLEMFDVLQ
jgi:hypothetical protein